MTACPLPPSCLQTGPQFRAPPRSARPRWRGYSLLAPRNPVGEGLALPLWRGQFTPPHEPGQFAGSRGVRPAMLALAHLLAYHGGQRGTGSPEAGDSEGGSKKGIGLGGLGVGAQLG